MKEEEEFFVDMRNGAIAVIDHIISRGELVEGVPDRKETPHRDSHLKALYDRCRAWALTLRKLDHPSDLQALACAVRSLLEIAVDMILLKSDKTNQSGWKMRCWDDSARLYMAIASVNERGISTGEPTHFENFIANRKDEIERMREVLWPTCVDKHGNPKHPNRWTGDWDILHDIKSADAECGQLIKDNLGTSLVKFYQDNYRFVNRTIHGSGVMGTTGHAKGLIFRGAHALWCAASLAMLCTQVILSDMGFDDHLPLSDEWDAIRLFRAKNLVEHTKRIEKEDFS